MNIIHDICNAFKTLLDAPNGRRYVEICMAAELRIVGRGDTVRLRVFAYTHYPVALQFESMVFLNGTYLGGRETRLDYGTDTDHLLRVRAFEHWRSSLKTLQKEAPFSTRTNISPVDEWKKIISHVEINTTQ